MLQSICFQFNPDGMPFRPIEIYGGSRSDVHDVISKLSSDPLVSYGPLHTLFYPSVVSAYLTGKSNGTSSTFYFTKITL